MKQVFAGVILMALAVSCGDEATGLAESEQVYFPLNTGDYWLWSYNAVIDREGVQNDYTETGTSIWEIEGKVIHENGSSLYEMSIVSTTIRYQDSVPVDTTTTEEVLYYMIDEGNVLEFYALSDTTSWLLLDSPLALGKTWTDVENQIYTVLNMDSTITVDAGSMANCAVVDCDWNISSLPTHYIRFFKSGVGVVYRNFHQEDENSLYDHTWELVNSNLLD